MSYARFSYADVYVFLSVYGHLYCCGCWLSKADESVPDRFLTTADMLAHLDKHRAAGHDVPEETYDRLRKDAAENDAWMAKVDAGMCSTCSGDGKCHPNHEVFTVHRKERCPDCNDTNVCWACRGRGGSPEWAAAHAPSGAPADPSGT